jgi:GDPmannose 4,6-dehydratase
VKKKCAIITGIYGQDGSLLAQFLLSKQYRVVGIVKELRQHKLDTFSVETISANICDPTEMIQIFEKYQPDEFYHLAAAHHSSEKNTEASIHRNMLEVNFFSTQNILGALLKIKPDCRFLYAGSSQMYTPEFDITVVDEKTPYRPSSYYGVTKVASANLIDLLRRTRGLWGVTVNLFNHESNIRAEQFLSRKVSLYVANIQSNLKLNGLETKEKLSIMDIDARTDWSAATDFVNAFYLSLQAQDPDDYILASGNIHTVSDLLNIAFRMAGLDWKDFVLNLKDPNSTLKPCLVGSPLKAKERLNWKPEITFSELIKGMVIHDLSK